MLTPANWNTKPIIYGLEITPGLVPDNQEAAAAQAFQILGEKSLAHPNPPAFIIKFWLFSYPSIAERLAFARSYDPWRDGTPHCFVP